MKSFQKITILLNFNLPQLLLFLFFLLLLPHQEPPEDFELLPHPPLLLRRPGSGLASLTSKTKAKNMKMQIAKVTLIFGVGTFLGRLYYFSWILIKPGMKSLFYRTIYFDLSTDFRFDDLYTKSIILFWSMNSIRYIFKHRVIVQQRLFMQVLDRFKLFWKIMFYTWLLDFH